MATNAFAISRRLIEKGVDKNTADAVAEEIVMHSDENHAAKADSVRLGGSVARLETKLNISIALNSAILIAFVVEKTVG